MSITEIENRLAADRAEYAGPGADQSIRDREYLLGLVKAQQARLERVATVADKWWANFPSKARAIRDALEAK